jgi:hypothetical protein
LLKRLIESAKRFGQRGSRCSPRWGAIARDSRSCAAQRALDTIFIATNYARGDTHVVCVVTRRAPEKLSVSTLGVKFYPRRPCAQSASIHVSSLLGLM